MRIFGKSALAIAATLIATSACGGTNAVPSGPMGNVSGSQASFGAVDSTSILKKLTKDVEIGSTVDPKNGDTGPRAISLVRSTFGLKAGQLLVCNFADSKGNAGKGSSIEVLDPTPGSKPTSFVRSSKIAGCDGDAITENNQIYATGLNGGVISQYSQDGKIVKSYTAGLSSPFSDADAFCGFPYAPEDIYISDVKTGAIIKFSFVAVQGGKPTITEVIKGFGVNKGSGWTLLGPSGIQYNGTHEGPLCNDTLYIADGVDNTVVAVSTASNLLQTDEIVVQPGGKKFKCAHPSATCAKVLYSGSPLNAPLATALLPNGNLIVANTKGGNTLVELTSAGKVLATKKLDNNKTADVFGILASGKTDSDTVLFYTDTATNTLHELTQ